MSSARVVGHVLEMKAVWDILYVHAAGRLIAKGSGWSLERTLRVYNQRISRRLRKRRVKLRYAWRTKLPPTHSPRAHLPMFTSSKSTLAHTKNRVERVKRQISLWKCIICAHVVLLCTTFVVINTFNLKLYIGKF
jgi:hypothetical protein